LTRPAIDGKDTAAGVMDSRIKKVEYWSELWYLCKFTDYGGCSLKRGRLAQLDRALVSGFDLDGALFS
jgi:hypothetical protein